MRDVGQDAPGPARAELAHLVPHRAALDGYDGRDGGRAAAEQRLVSYVQLRPVDPPLPHRTAAALQYQSHHLRPRDAFEDVVGARRGGPLVAEAEHDVGRGRL